MNRRSRHWLFLACAVIFLLLSYVLVEYAFGLQFDWVNWQLVKTGSLALRANVSADVYINDALSGRTSLLSKAFSASRLLPRLYNIRVSADSYQTWQKKADIRAGLILDFPHVVLVPESLPEESVTSGSFSFPKIDQKPFANEVALLNSPDNNKTLWFNQHEIWIQWLTNTNNQPYKNPGDKELITRYSQTIRDVQWYKDSAHLLVNFGSSTNSTLRLLEIDTRGGFNSFDITSSKSIIDRFYYDPNSNLIYLLKGQGITSIAFP